MSNNEVPEKIHLIVTPDKFGGYEIEADLPFPVKDAEYQYIRADLLKRYSTAFFYWWYNQPGANTEQGFDQWVAEGMPGVQRTPIHEIIAGSDHE